MNFVRVSFISGTTEVERQEIGANAIVTGLGSNRVAAGTASMTVTLRFDFNSDTNADRVAVLFDFTDDRWTFGSRYVFLRQNPKKGPTKIGLAHPVPWVAYLNQGTLFVKRFGRLEWADYPDMGTTYQTFSNEDMLEMETVGPLVTLIPGQSAELEETWELFTDVPDVKTEADVDRVILPLLNR